MGAGSCARADRSTGVTGLGIFLFAAAILFSIGLHEFGHFITAKKFGIKVEQFFIGFGPKIWSTRRGETEYGFKALPLGGFVRIAGMNPFEEVPEEDRGRIFKSRAPWKRAIVLAAGSFTHFVVALFIIAGVLSIAGVRDPDLPTTTIAAISPNTPAATAGLKPGDRLVAIDGITVDSWTETTDVIKARPGETVEVEYIRNGVREEADVTIASERPDGTKTGFLGVGPEFELVKRSVPGAFVEAGKQIGTGAKASLLAFKDIFSPSTLGRLFSVATGDRERTVNDPATLIGIGNQAGHLARTGNFAGLFYIIAGFNIFIGVANLLPLPPLDGGHLAVLAYEKVTRREVDLRKLIPITAAVISVFGALFVLLLYLDIVSPLPPIPG